MDTSTTIQIREASAQDLDWLTELCRLQFRVAHEGAMRPQDLEYCLNMLFNEDAMAEDLADPSALYLVAESERKGLGCVKLAAAELELARKLPDAVEIMRVYVQPECMGKGVAARLMEAAYETARRQGYTSMWLHVYHENTRAIRFYEKCGFTKAGEQVYPVRESRPLGWVMKKELDL